MEDYYDLIVVGGGPAGSITARTAATQGLSVLLIEKKQEIGEPLRCAEGLVCDGLQGFIEPDSRWICSRVRRLRIHSKGVEVNLKDDRDAIYVTDRKIFDRELARMAAAAGAEVMTKTQATGLTFAEGKVSGIRGKCCGDDFTAGAGAVVAADGIESRVARWAGIDTTLGLQDIATSAQYHLTDIDIDPGQIELYYGSDRMPGGFGWIFPKGEREANVGLCTVYDRKHPRKPFEILDHFVQSRFPGARVLASVTGAVPVSGMLPKLSSGGIVAIGDAGRLADPVTGEGIINGMISGRIAGNLLADCIRKGDTSPAALLQYDREIARVLGPALERNYALKEYMRKSSDTKISLIIRAAKTMGIEKYSTSGALNEIFNPRSKSAARLMRTLIR